MRITKTMCQTQVDMLNTTLHGDAETHRKEFSSTGNSLAPQVDGRWRSIPGRYVIDHSYGGYKLCRYCNEGGGEYDVTNYRMTARELYYVLTGINTVLRLDAHRPMLLETEVLRYA